MDMPNHETLIDFYKTDKYKHSIHVYHMLNDLIARDKIMLFDYDSFWEDEQWPMHYKSWTYIATPSLWHPLVKNKNINSKKENEESSGFIDFLPIPPLEDRFYISPISGQKLPTIDHLIFIKLILLAEEYNSLKNVRQDIFVKRVQRNMQFYLNILVIYYQHAVDNWWELVELSGENTTFLDYEELLPPLRNSDFNITEIPDSAKELKTIIDVKMLDNENILFIAEEGIAHFTLPSLDKLYFSVPRFNFCCVQQDICVFYHEEGFMNYHWKEKHWSNTLISDISYIILSPEDDIDLIFHLRKKIVLEIPELMDHAVIKVKDPAGSFVLLLDKEAHGGIYDLQTLSKAVDANCINWYMDIDEINLDIEEEDHKKIPCKAAAIWVGGNQYKMLAYGKIISDNKLQKGVHKNLQRACFSPDGKYLLLTGMSRCSLLETTNYTAVNTFAI